MAFTFYNRPRCIIADHALEILKNDLSIILKVGKEEFRILNELKIERQRKLPK
jgi:hypothetical protein